MTSSRTGAAHEPTAGPHGAMLPCARRVPRRDLGVGSAGKTGDAPVPAHYSRRTRGLPTMTRISVTTTTNTPAPSSALVLGAMAFGTRLDDDACFALLDRFVERGGEWIDTADCYTFWDSPTGRGGDSEQ